MCTRIGVPSLALVLNYWILAPLHILPYTHSSLHSAYVRSHRCALARSGTELLDPSSATQYEVLGIDFFSKITLFYVNIAIFFRKYSVFYDILTFIQK